MFVSLNSNMLEELLKVKQSADCLWDARQMEQVYERLAEEIERDLGGTDPLALCIMRGGLFLTVEILKRIDHVLGLDYAHATRYRHEIRGGEMSWIYFPEQSVRGRDILLIDDILDEGVTLENIHEACIKAGANCVHSAVLAIKEHDRRVPAVSADYIGVPVEDRYVFGCGMDYKGYFRNLNAIYAVGEQKGG